MDEKLYKIRGYEDYGITKTGKIYSYITKKWLSLDRSCRGYCKIRLADRRLGKFITFQVHRLVATQFLPNPYNLPEVNHKDGNHGNNSVWNLEWCTREYNMRHAKETGLYKIEEDSPRAKLTKEQVIEIYKEYEKGSSKRDISRKYNVSDCLVGEIVRGVRWSKTYAEYYGHTSEYKKPARRFIDKSTIKNILIDYYINNMDTVQLQQKYKFDNSHIGYIVKGKRHSQEVKECLQEIKNSLDNQQPSSSNLEKVQRL